MGFTLHFHFGANDFFTNEILTKTYELKCEPQEDDPFSFEVCSQLSEWNLTHITENRADSKFAKMIN